MMPVQVTLDSLLKQRGMSGKDLAQKVGLSETQLSLFRSNKVKGIRFSTLSRLCLVLDCEPGELLSYTRDQADLAD